jgi:glycosyltransferase involved in cell wall biosynthesis
LYSINARIGGYGLDLNAHEALKLSHGEGYLGRAVAFDNRQTDIPARFIHSLRWDPVRLLSFLSSPFYYDVKKRRVDAVAARLLRTGRYDFFHGWENNSLLSLREARARGIPSVLEIPTWHRDKGKVKPRDQREVSRIEREARFPDTLFKRVLIGRQETVEEYELADVLLVPSECSAATFTSVGIPREKIVMLGAGVNLADYPEVQREVPTAFSAARPLRAVFLGALIKRKGAHVLLEAWRLADLPHAELTLVGAVHEEVRPALEKFAHPSIRVAGFTRDVASHLLAADLHVFPSSCEGSAKTVYEACAAGLAQITTFESGDVVQQDLNGVIVPPENPAALAEALRALYRDPARIRRYQVAARQRAVAELTWDHFRTRLAAGYELAIRRCRSRLA